MHLVRRVVATTAWSWHGYRRAFRATQFAHIQVKDHVGISELTGTPIVQTHHPDTRRVMPIIMQASNTFSLLQLFDQERDDFGWATSVDVIKIITKMSQKKSGRASHFDTSDERFQSLLHVPLIAIKQGVMDSMARRGHSTDDLSSLKDSLEYFQLESHELYTVVCEKLMEEEDDEDEPGEVGHDFSGGSVGF
jgi:hypothetical protein